MPCGRRSFRELAWAGFLFKATNSDDAYLELMGKQSFLRCLREDTGAANARDIGEFIISRFLNRWGCRIASSDELFHFIKQRAISLHAEIQLLASKTILDFHGGLPVVGGQRERPAISEIYQRFRAPGFGPTSVSKLLHVMNPGLFLMWDDAILKHYREHNPAVRDSGDGYVAFLAEMQSIGREIVEDYGREMHGGSWDPAAFLNEHLGYSHPKTLAKYLDEYNWAVCTRNWWIPPSWHPGMLRGVRS